MNALFNTELDIFEPPPLASYATYSNRRSNRFRLFNTRRMADYSMQTTTRGMPEGGILYELDGHSWREVWRWQPPTTCHLCNKPWSRMDEAVPLTAPASKAWHQLVYVHKICKSGTGI